MKFTVFFAALACVSPALAALPVVDLITTRHQAVENTTGGYYTFKNIPYAEAPLGPLRFRHPIPRVTVSRSIDDGSNGRTCPQAGGPWFQHSIPLVAQTIAQTCNNTNGQPGGPPPPTGLPESEDCLILDVSVPRSVWENKGSTKRPVLVWIHGGGYIEGSKESGNAPRLLEKSVDGDREGMIVVSINYRLGLFGFPPRQPWMWDVASNAGLYDQRLALEWVRFNIRKFGGDPSRVTVIGESAGGGSIMAHLSAFGGIDGVSPFQRAIMQSPAMKPAVTADRYEALYEDFLETAGVSGYSEARGLSSEELVGVNAAMIGQAAFADTVFGPNVDGLFIPDQPIRLMASKKVDADVSLIVAHNSDEGLLFTDPRVSDEAGFKSLFQALMPNVAAAKIDELAADVYPPDFSGTQPYADMTSRLKLALGEALFDCNAFATSVAYGNETRGYLFDICPGMHAQDEGYTFFNGESADSLGLLIDAEVADAMQGWFVDFTIRGVEGGSEAAELPVFRADAQVALVGLSGAFDAVRDPAANERCRWWMNGF